MYISLYDLGLAILILVAILAAVYAVVALRQVAEMVADLRKILAANADNLNKSMAALPDLMKNASGLAESAQEQIDNIGSTVGVLGHSIADTAASFSEKTVTGVSFMRSLMDTIAIIREYIALRKENS